MGRADAEESSNSLVLAGTDGSGKEEAAWTDVALLERLSSSSQGVDFFQRLSLHWVHFQDDPVIPLGSPFAS